jgi:hypothetical protein
LSNSYRFRYPNGGPLDLITLCSKWHLPLEATINRIISDDCASSPYINFEQAPSLLPIERSQR